MVINLFGRKPVVLTLKKRRRKKKPAKKALLRKLVKKALRRKKTKKVVHRVKKAKVKKKARITKRTKKTKGIKIKRRSRMAEEGKKPEEEKVAEELIGEVTHFFPHVNAAVIKLNAPLSIGETIHIKGHTTDFTEKVESMQIDNAPIEDGKSGDEVGLLVKEKVRASDKVYKA